MTTIPIEAAPLIVARVLRRRNVTTDKPRMSCFDGKGREWIASDNDDGTVTVTKAAQDSQSSAKQITVERLTSELSRAKQAWEAAKEHYRKTKDKASAVLASQRKQEADRLRGVYEDALKALTDYEDANPIVKHNNLLQSVEYFKGQIAKKKAVVERLEKAKSEWESKVDAQRAAFVPTKDQPEFKINDPTQDALEEIDQRTVLATEDLDKSKAELEDAKKQIKALGYEPEQNIVITVDLDGPWLFA